MYVQKKGDHNQQSFIVESVHQWRTPMTVRILTDAIACPVLTWKAISRGNLVVKKFTFPWCDQRCSRSGSRERVIRAIVAPGGIYFDRFSEFYSTQPLPRRCKKRKNKKKEGRDKFYSIHRRIIYEAVSSIKWSISRYRSKDISYYLPIKKEKYLRSIEHIH